MNNKELFFSNPGFTDGGFVTLTRTHLLERNGDDCHNWGFDVANRPDEPFV
jgi:hypothetical protein